MNAKIFVKIFTWLKEKIFRKEKSTYNFKTKTNNINNTFINPIIKEVHIHNSFFIQEDKRSKYNKKINKK